MTRAESTYSKIRDAILEGNLRPGERLVENDICVRFGVGRTPLREAIRQLQTEGLVEFLPRKGATIKRISLEEMAEIYDILAVLEAHAARLAVQRSHSKISETYSKIHNELEQAKKRKDYETWKKENWNLHLSLVKASKSSHLLTTITKLRSIIYRHGFIGLSIPGSIKKFHQAHCDILSAILENNPEKTAKAVEKHIREVAEQVLKHLEHYPTF